MDQNKKPTSKRIRRNWYMRHDPDFKRKVALEYLEGGKTSRQIANKYGTVDFTQVASWVRALKKELKQKDTSTFPVHMAKETQKVIKSDDYKEILQKLELAKLKVAGLETIIDIAEEQLGFSIRKKYGTRQS